MALAKNKAAPPPPPEKEEIIYEPCAPIWMLTMGDTMSLLLTFFVMLLTFSTPDSGRLMEAIGSMKGAFGIIEVGDKGSNMPVAPKQEDNEKGEVEGGGREDVQVNKENLTSVSLRTLKVANRYSEFKEKLLEMGFDRFITTQHFDQGIMMEADFDKLFVSGTAELDRNASVLLQAFANLAGSVGNELQLTANFSSGDASGKRYSAEWSLARDRLAVIGDLFFRKFHIARVRLSYGYRIITDDRPAYLSVLLAEKIGTNEISMTELINIKQGTE